MPRLDLELGGEKHEPCGDRRGISHLAWGTVKADGQPSAAYHVGWTTGEAHDAEAVVDLTVGLGAWGDGTDASMRRAFHVKARPVRRRLRAPKPGFGLVDAPFVDEPGTLGANHTRASALQSPALELLWQVVDVVIEADPRVAGAMRRLIAPEP